jgi:putative ABC transport system substrate-binding protein
MRLSRRRFVVGASASSAALLAGCGRLPWQAEQPRTLHRIGWLQLGPFATSTPANREAFRQELRELGYVEGQNFVVEYRSADGQESRLPELAAELAQLPVDLILTVSLATEAAHIVTSTVPIVMLYPADPTAAGLVASLARPGGNVTGLTYFAGQLQQKRLELLRETVPGLSRVAVVQEGRLASVARDFQDLEVAAQGLGLRLLRLDVDGPGDLDAAFDAATREGAEGLLLGGISTLFPHRARLVALAAQHQLPAMYFLSIFVRDGGLMAYAVNLESQFRRAAHYVDRILKGARPADLPIEQPMRFEFVVNMKTARELGITFPHEVALQITEVIDG